jgi:hypothetical protein
VKFFSSKRRAIALAALVLLLLFILRPGASRLKSRIVNSISSAVGRPVEVGSVQIRLLPRPGFELHDLVVYDDPAFGAEPMLRCSEVSAALRVTSLLRGRLEVARLDLTEPSLNLVHAPQGGWNLEALVEHSAHKALAPTSKAKLEPRPGFPYIEGTSARINFKNGAEKKPYALTNADFALWQDSENTWGVRLKTQPFRSDFNLNDTGILQVNGTWQRASLVRDTPLQFSVEWNRAQLGQLTKFFSGSDQGWRGTAQLDLTLTGTPAHLEVASSASVQDFRRYDIENGNALKLAAHCKGQYSSLDHTFHALDCMAPVGDGRVTVNGDMGFPGTHTFDLVVAVENVPASAAVALVHRAKKNLPDDLTAGGVIQGRLAWRVNAEDHSKSRFEGRGEISGFRLASVSNKVEMGPETVPFVFAAESPKLTAKERGVAIMAMPEGPHVEFGPLPVAMGRGVTARGWIAHSGYNIALAGDADISKTLRLARMVGLPAMQANAEGLATVDLRISGPWIGEPWTGGRYDFGTGFAGPQVTGSAKLRNVRVAFRGTGAPVEILSAELQLLPEAAHVEKLSVKAADAQWTGSVQLPRGCGSPDACQPQFNLHASQISLHALNNWIDPKPAERPWYRVLDSGTQVKPSLLSNLHASGSISFDHFEMRGVTVTQVAAHLRMDHGKIDITQISGSMFAGRLAGEWHADDNVTPAICRSSGTLNGISLTRVADVMKGESFTGTANTTFELKGTCGAEFWPSAEGFVRFSASNAVLPNLSLADDATPLRIIQFSGQAKMEAGHLAINDATVDSGSGKFQLSGTASLNGDLELKLARPANFPGAGFAITGTLAQPRVKTAPGLEQARLKTDPAK